MRAAQAAGLAALAVHEGDALEAASLILLDAHADGPARCDAGRFGQAREENLALVEAGAGHISTAAGAGESSASWKRILQQNSLAQHWARDWRALEKKNKNWRELGIGPPQAGVAWGG